MCCIAEAGIIPAGGIAQARVGGRDLPGTSGDAKSLMYDLSKNFDDLSSNDTKRYRWLHACGSLSTSKEDALDIQNITLALCMKENTTDALSMFVPYEALRLASEPHFIFLAEAADRARAILNEHWGLVLALATRLLAVGKMSGEELARFLMFAEVDHVKHLGDHLNR